MRKRELDNKIAAYVFMAIIFVWLLFSIIADAFAQGRGLDLNDFWVSSALGVVRYILFLGIFIFISRQIGLRGRALFNEINLNNNVNIKNIYITIILAGLCIIGFMLISAAFSELFKVFGYMEPNGDLGMDSPEKYLMMVFALALLPAIVEELLFRGLILKGLMSHGQITAVIASAVLFSLFHLSPAQTVYQFVLGVIFAIVVLKTGNLIYSMILHFVNNFIVITYTYIAGDPAVYLNWNLKTIAITVVLAVFAVIFIVRLVQALKQHNKIKYGRTKFFTFENIGYYLCLALSGIIWIIEFVGYE